MTASLTTGMLGRKIDDYEILEALDDGGVASVFLARSMQDKKTVALKIMREEALETENFQKRFHAEVEMMTALNHPHIIKVYATGKFLGKPYMVLEYARGGSLANHFVSADDWTIDDTNLVIAQIADALDHAHAHNMIHRDIKLENVLIDGRNAKLIDFGMAKDLMPEEDSHSNHVTSTGIVLGTPHYLSPEQCKFEQVDSRSDVYSLGIMLFYMLSKKFPFDAPFPAAVMMMHLEKKPPRVTDFNPDLPDAVADVVDKALAKNPNDRYPTAGMMSKALQQALNKPITNLTFIEEEKSGRSGFNFNINLNMPEMPELSPNVILGLATLSCLVVAGIFIGIALSI